MTSAANALVLREKDNRIIGLLCIRGSVQVYFALFDVVKRVRRNSFRNNIHCNQWGIHSVNVLNSR